MQDKSTTVPIDKSALDQHTSKQFNQWATTYDTRPWNYYFFYLTNRKMLKILNPREGSYLLDVGCGTGLLLEQLAQTRQDLKLYGLDVSEGMLNNAKQKLSKYPNVQLQLGSANVQPYEDNTFDYVTCIHSFHHHPDSLQSLREMNRVLKPEGTLLILDLSLDGPLRRAQRILEQKLFPERETNISRYTRSAMKGLFEQANLEVTRQTQLWYFSLVTIGRKKG